MVKVAGFAGWCVGLSRLLSFPLCGNVLNKPLDSGLRRNDGRGWGWDFFENGKGAVGIATNPFRPPLSFRRRLESKRAEPQW